MSRRGLATLGVLGLIELPRSRRDAEHRDASEDDADAGTDHSRMMASATAAARLPHVAHTGGS